MTDRSNSLFEVNLCLGSEESAVDELGATRTKMKDLLNFFCDELENCFNPTKEKKELIKELAECLESLKG